MTLTHILRALGYNSRFEVHETPFGPRYILTLVDLKTNEVVHHRGESFPLVKAVMLRHALTR